MTNWRAASSFRVLAILPILACTHPREIRQSIASCSESDSAAATAIRQRLADWVEAFNSGDRARAGDIWARPVVGWFPTASIYGDSAAFAAVNLPFQSDASVVRSYDVTVEEVDVSRPIAVVHDVWAERRRFSNGAVADRIIRGSEFWRCSADGKWRISRWVSAPEAWRRAP